MNLGSTEQKRLEINGNGIGLCPAVDLNTLLMIMKQIF